MVPSWTMRFEAKHEKLKRLATSLAISLIFLGHWLFVISRGSAMKYQAVSMVIHQLKGLWNQAQVLNYNNFIFHCVQDQDHLLPLCYFDNILYFKNLITVDYKLPHIITSAKSVRREALLTSTVSGNACTVEQYTDLAEIYFRKWFK